MVEGLRRREAAKRFGIHRNTRKRVRATAATGASWCFPFQDPLPSRIATVIGKARKRAFLSTENSKGRSRSQHDMRDAQAIELPIEKLVQRPLYAGPFHRLAGGPGEQFCRHRDGKPTQAEPKTAGLFTTFLPNEPTSPKIPIDTWKRKASSTINDFNRSGYRGPCQPLLTGLTTINSGCLLSRSCS
jgi:hypothetical protein